MNNQKEYDTILKMAKEAVAEMDSIEVPQALIDFLYHGKRGVKNPGLGKYNLELVGYESQYADLLEAGVTPETIIKEYKTNKIVGKFTNNATVVDVATALSSVNSAYHAMVENKIDCDSFSNTFALVYDLVGIDNGIIAEGNHAFPIYKLDDQWVYAEGIFWSDMSGFFKKNSTAKWHTRPHSISFEEGLKIERQ